MYVQINWFVHEDNIDYILLTVTVTKLIEDVYPKLFSKGW